MISKARYEGENMAALNTVARAQGAHKAMEVSISATARVRRRLKSGPKRTTRSLQLNSFEALGRLVKDAERACGLMLEAGLDPKDVHLGLIDRTATDIHCKWLPAPKETGPFFAAITGMADAEFLGILWHQTDREVQANGVPLSTYWVTPFVAEPEAQKQMLALRDFVTAGGMHAN
jgi:hypothetical protein